MPGLVGQLGMLGERKGQQITKPLSLHPLRLGMVLLAFSTLVFGLLTTLQATAQSFNPKAVEGVATPSVAGVSGNVLVRANDWIVLRGLGFGSVSEVLVDSLRTDHYLQSATKLSILIPAGVKPGDAVITLIGEFGTVQMHNLFEVLAGTQPNQSKITIGTFQGYAAVYTKNLRGQALTILVAERQRNIQELRANFTQNLTFVGVGKIVTVRVYLDRKLMRVKQLLIR